MSSSYFLISTQAKLLKEKNFQKAFESWSFQVSLKYIDLSLFLTN